MSLRSLLCFAMSFGLGCAAPVTTELPVNEVRFTLLDAGSAPRTLLRLQARPGDRTSSELTVEAEMSMAFVEERYSTPTTHVAHVWFDTEVIEITPGNDIRSESVVRRLSADDEDAQARLNVFEGLGWSTVEDRRGFIRQQGVIAQAALTPEQQQALDSMNRGIIAEAWTLPEVPVGIGAQWQVEESVEVYGMRVRQRLACTVTGIDGNMLSLAVTLSQTAPAQLVSSPDLPGERAELISFETAGSGSLQRALDRIDFIKGTLTSTTALRVKAADQDDPSTFGMKLRLKLGIESQ